MVNIKIHRGTSQIGGTITEIYTENSHIFIDFGSQLTVNPEESTDYKMIEMINNTECDAVLFSHYHGDHVGLLEYIPQKDIRGKKIRLGIGKVARQVLANIQRTLANDISRPEEQQTHREMLKLLEDNNRWQDFTDALTVGNEDSSSFDIGDFHIITIRVDHSAYDSYMFIIEAEGKCIVHTGDFRVHGRLGEGFFERLKSFMKNKEVDVLLIEGTMLGRLDEKTMSEEELQEEATRLLELPENKYVYLICSSTNMESLASFHNAVLNSNARKQKQGNNKNRAMYVNFYIDEQMKLFASAEPNLTKRFMKVYPFERYGKYNKKLHMSQIEYMEKNGFLCMIGTSEGYKKYIEPFKDKNPLLIYSMWQGYVSDKNEETNEPKLKDLYESFPKERRKDLHTSGHAVKDTIEEMIVIVNPLQAVIPLHTEYKEKFNLLKGAEGKTVCLGDGVIYHVKERKTMIEQKMIKRMIKNIKEWEYEGGTPFTVLPPSYGEPNLLRVYGCGGLFVRIRYANFDTGYKDIYMMHKNYYKSLESDEEKNDLNTYLKKAENLDYAVKLFGGEEDGKIDNQFMELAVKAMRNRWKKKTELPKERNVQDAIVSNFVRNNTKWKVVAQEVQFEKAWFSEGEFTDGTTETERFDLIVMSEKGLGFVELKVNNANYQNLNSHYEHMQFVKSHPQKFVEEIDRRFELIKEYGLWKEDELKKYDNKKIWFGFLFVNGGEEKCKSIVESYFKEKQHNSDETYYMYYEGNIEKLDINNMKHYEDFMAYES